MFHDQNENNTVPGNAISTDNAYYDMKIMKPKRIFYQMNVRFLDGCVIGNKNPPFVDYFAHTLM